MPFLYIAVVFDLYRFVERPLVWKNINCEHMPKIVDVNTFLIYVAEGLERKSALSRHDYYPRGLYLYGLEMPNEGRDITFYAELVVVTVVALIVANVWVDLLRKGIHWMFPHSYVGELIAAVIITALAIPFLHKIFGQMEGSSPPKITLTQRLV